MAKSNAYDSNVVFIKKKKIFLKDHDGLLEEIKENQECSIGKTKTIAMFVTNITKPSFFKLKVRQRFLFVCLFFKDSGYFLILNIGLGKENELNCFLKERNQRGNKSSEQLPLNFILGLSLTEPQTNVRMTLEISGFLIR